MTRRAALAALRRLSRNLPGHRRARKLAIRWVLRSPRLQRAVATHRSRPSGRRPLSFAPSTVFAPDQGRELDVLVVVALGLRAEAASPTAERLVQAQLITSAFRSVVVLDAPYFAEFRRYGLPVELVLSSEAYARLHDSMGYSSYLARRIPEIVQSYRAAGVVPLGRDGTTDMSLDCLLATAATPR